MRDLVTPTHGTGTELPAPSVADLRLHFEQQNQEWKNGKPWLQSRVRQAYCDWFRASVKAGNPPDALVRHIQDETERFLDRVIAGVDGCSYWGGGQAFVKNDGKAIRPRRWWYQHVHGTIGPRDAVKPNCGDHECIAPPHMGVTLWSEQKRQYSDQACMGALQVAAMKLGHTPTILEYEHLGLRPSARAISLRFSSWIRALEAAGLPPSVSQTGWTRTYSDEDCIAAIQAFHAETGRVPKGIEWAAAHLTPSERTIRDRLGGWHVALVKAGLK